VEKGLATMSILAHRRTPMRDKRKRMWIDRFQTHLGVRLIFLFASYQSLVWLVVLFGHSMAAGLASLLGPGAIACWLLLLLGAVATGCLLFLFDTVRLTHRVVGPLYRFQEVIQAITNGDALPLVQIRKDDFLHEMKDELNGMNLG
jgi:hypothetical protein